MGYSKDISPQLPQSNKVICLNCIKDSDLKKYILNKASNNSCSYCHKKSRVRHISIKLNELRDYILKCIGYAYRMNPFVSKGASFMKDGYTISNEDLLYNEGVSEDKNVIDDLVELLPDERWLKEKEWYGEFIPSWSDFVEATESLTSFDDEFNTPCIESDAPINSSVILNKLFHYINHLYLFKTINKNHVLYKARAEKQECSLIKMGAHSNTEDGRMNPAGQPMLYTSLDKETALAEIKEDGLKTVAQFKVKRNSTFLDLSNIMPESIFFHPVSSNRELLEFISFIDNFVEALSKEKNNNNPNFYKPTQFIIHHFKKSNKFKTLPLGIIYRSAKNYEALNIAIWGNAKLPPEDQVTGINNMLKIIQCELLE